MSQSEALQGENSPGEDSSDGDTETPSRQAETQSRQAEMPSRQGETQSQQAEMPSRQSETPSPPLGDDNLTGRCLFAERVMSNLCVSR